MTSAKVRARLKEIAAQQAKLVQELDGIEVRLVIGAEVIEEGLKLLERAEDLYGKMSDTQRQLLNRALFQELYVRDNEFVSTVFNEPFSEFISARDALAGTLNFPDMPIAEGWICENRAVLLEPAPDRHGGRCRARTDDLLVVSQLLYRLS